MPLRLRCQAVLQGNEAGRILVDDPLRPCWAVVQEQYDGVLYLGGTLAAPVLAQLVDQLREERTVVILLAYDDPRLAILPPNPDYVGAAIDFTQRSSQHDDQLLQRWPQGCQLQRIDADLFPRCADYAAWMAAYGSAEQALANRVGFCLLKEEVIVCEALSGPPTLGVMEMGVATHEAHRGRGYATFTCLHVGRECERIGYQTFWNTAKQNLASTALARKLGYQVEEEFKVFAWSKCSQVQQ
jgi:RimJ/RimL family protein N-acetyltransferase